MATETPTDDGAGESGRAGLKANAKWYVLSYPLFWLVAVFLIPLSMLVVFSFWVNIPGGQYEMGFTLENYVRFLTSSLYLGQTWLTIELSLVTAILAGAWLPDRLLPRADEPSVAAESAVAHDHLLAVGDVRHPGVRLAGYPRLGRLSEFLRRRRRNPL